MAKKTKTKAKSGAKKKWSWQWGIVERTPMVLSFVVYLIRSITLVSTSYSDLSFCYLLLKTVFF